MRRMIDIPNVKTSYLKRVLSSGFSAFVLKAVFKTLKRLKVPCMLGKSLDVFLTTARTSKSSYCLVNMVLMLVFPVSLTAWN